MDGPSKRLWIVTFANVAVIFLLLLVLYAIRKAVAAFAAEVSGWPLHILLPLGLALSITGLMFTKGVRSRISRRVCLVTNGCVLGIDLVIVFGFAALFLSGTKEQYLIPEGYQGEVYVTYGVPDGQILSKARGAVIYHIPEDGVLAVQAPMTRERTRPEYYYQSKPGTLKRIRYIWVTTIDRTAENMANDKDLGVFFPTTGTFTDSNGCSVQFLHFSVATKAYLLRDYKKLDLSEYLKAHPAHCMRQQR